MLELGLGLAVVGVLGFGMFAIYKWGSQSALNRVLEEEVEDAQADSDQMRKPLATDDEWASAARDNLRRSEED